MVLHNILALGAALLALGSGLWAASQLRLSQTVVGPVPVTQGSNAGQQIVYANNIGDGSLNLQLTTNEAWIQTTSGRANCRATPAQLLVASEASTQG